MWTLLAVYLKNESINKKKKWVWNCFYQIYKKLILGFKNEPLKTNISNFYSKHRICRLREEKFKHNIVGVRTETRGGFEQSIKLRWNGEECSMRSVIDFKKKRFFWERRNILSNIIL